MNLPTMISSALLLLGASSCGAQQSGEVDLAEARVVADGPPAPVRSRPELTEAEKQFYRDMARASWRYLEANYQQATGLVNATPHWQYITLWDIGGQILAFLAAKHLGLIDQAEFDQRIRKTLGTMEKVPLHGGVTFTRIYSTRDGSVGGSDRGWSATDLGRFLIALRILAEREPQHAQQAERIVRRSNFSRIVRNGYLHGQGRDRNGKPRNFQEGRIGYEQYVAQGFKHWGQNVGNALKLSANAEPVTVNGVPLLADRRYGDRLLSEPFILLGLELGLPDDMRTLAENVLRAQEARYRETGQVTVVSEDAVGVPPSYFYYYCVLCNRTPFVIGVSTPGTYRDSPRWVSTKAAFGWHAIMPNEYTRKATEYVAAAFDPKRGWASGVYEGNARSTETFDINTAAVLLEVAYYQLRGGRPLIEPES